MHVGLLLADRYELVRPLAEGAMSTVWVARDVTSGEDVAVKAISLEAAGWRSEVRDRFMKEARLLARGKHEHLVEVRDVGETEDGFLYLVLDLLDGETLADRLSRETVIAWKEAVALALGITRGVGALHRVGIVHRDLKPANIVLHRTAGGPIPKIIDLGIGKASAAVGDAELCATLTATGQILGTPQYMSYEQALGQSDIDARSDVWALGVILYEMLTGTRPFDAPNTNAVLAAIRRGSAKPLRELARDVPASVMGVVERCLEVERSARYGDADALAAALADALARPGVPADKPSAPVRRRFVLVLGAMATAVPVAIVVALRLTGGASPDVARAAVHVDLTPAPHLSASVAMIIPSASIAVSATGPASPIVSPANISSAHKVPSSRPRSTPVTRVDEAGF